MTEECLSVVIPAYNEEATLVAVVQRVLSFPQLHEVVIVDDCSRDKTGVIAPILEGDADVVYGSRFQVRKSARGARTGP